jgi:hypothetical protein
LCVFVLCLFAPPCLCVVFLLGSVFAAFCVFFAAFCVRFVCQKPGLPSCGGVLTKVLCHGCVIGDVCVSS